MKRDTRIKLPYLENPPALFMLLLMEALYFYMGDSIAMGVFFALCGLTGFMLGGLAFGRFVPVGRPRGAK